jgi:hypothetical protein
MRCPFARTKVQLAEFWKFPKIFISDTGNAQNLKITFSAN